MFERYLQLFCDTSFFYACLDKSDADHLSAIEVAKEISRNSTRCCTTWDVVSETLTLLRYRAGNSFARLFIKNVLPTLEIIEYEREIREEALRLFLKFNEDHKLSFCDCISYVVIIDQLGRIPCASFDDDFKTLGLIVVPNPKE